MNTGSSDEKPARASRSYSGYTPLVLRIYDFLVHGINNRFYWKCPTRNLLANYAKHLSDNHLEIGPGTGYFLDKCGMPGAHPRLVLCDMNPHCLEKAGHRLRRFHPVAHHANILQPLENLGTRFRSVGLNYVLHCLPGDLKSKRKVFEHAAAWIEPGGVFFGSTILGREVPVSFAARLQMRWLNSRGYFCNQNDSLSDLKESLAAVFAESHIEMHGCVAIFSARAAV